MTMVERVKRTMEYMKLKQYPISENDYETGYNDAIYEAIGMLDIVLELEKLKVDTQ